MKNWIIRKLRCVLGITRLAVEGATTDNNLEVFRIAFNELRTEFDEALSSAKLNRGIARLEAVEKFVSEATERRREWENYRRKLAEDRDERLRMAKRRSDRIEALENEVAKLKGPLASWNGRMCVTSATEATDSDRFRFLAKQHDDLHRDFHALLDFLKLQATSEPVVGFTGEQIRVIRKAKKSK